MSPLKLRVVLYQEDGLWVAHALEMDLIGTGRTEPAALRELRTNVEVQLAFARQERTNPFQPAPEPVQALWNESNLAALGLSRARSGPALRTRVLEWDHSQVSRIRSNGFQCA